MWYLMYLFPLNKNLDLPNIINYYFVFCYSLISPHKQRNEEDVNWKRNTSSTERVVVDELGLGSYATIGNWESVGDKLQEWFEEAGVKAFVKSGIISFIRLKLTMQCSGGTVSSVNIVFLKSNDDTKAMQVLDPGHTHFARQQHHLLSISTRLLLFRRARLSQIPLRRVETILAMA